MSTLSRVLILSMLLAFALSYPADPAPGTINQEGSAAPVEGDEKTVDGRWGGHHHGGHHQGGWSSGHHSSYGGHGSYGGHNQYGGYNQNHGSYLGWREGQKTADGSPAAPADAAAAPPAPAPAVAADKIKFD